MVNDVATGVVDLFNQDPIKDIWTLFSFSFQRSSQHRFLPTVKRLLMQTRGDKPQPRQTFLTHFINKQKLISF